MRTNCKKAKENIKKYIVDNYEPNNYTPSDYGLKPSTDFKVVAQSVYDTFVDEFIAHQRETANPKTFGEWCRGLPTILDTPHIYGGSAVEILGDILEQSEYERNKYTEEQAEGLLNWLMYREISAVIEKR